MSARPIRIVVVGAGHMGSLHAKKVVEAARAGETVVLAGIVDVHPERAQRLAAELGAAPLAADREVSDRADAVIVAVPTVAHAAVVEPLLGAGLDVLLEKPIAASIGEAQALIDAAKRHGRVLQVGHLERFNPAVRSVRDRIARPRFIEAHRLGPFPGRATDVDVVRDLMIHDLDLLQHLVGEEPERIDAIGIPVLSQEIDIANARLVHPGGCVANLTASRVSVEPLRRLRVFQPSGYLSIDLLAKSAVFFHRREGDDEAPRIEMEKLEIAHEDALLAQLCSFLGAVRARGEPEVSGVDAMRTLRTALRVVDAMPPLERLQ